MVEKVILIDPRLNSSLNTKLHDCIHIAGTFTNLLCNFVLEGKHFTSEFAIKLHHLKMFLLIICDLMEYFSYLHLCS